MKLSSVKFTVVFFVLQLAGCAGTNFMRVTDEALILGKTTKEQIEARLGAPYQQGVITKNEQQMKTASYAYASSGGGAVAEGVIPARSQGFYFFNNKLVGYEFTSSWKSDSSNFNNEKIAQIRKGASTHKDVLRLLGKPGGKYIYPLIEHKDREAINYLYSQTKGGAFNLKFYKKQLVVVFNKQGIVTDVEYTEAGEK